MLRHICKLFACIKAMTMKDREKAYCYQPPFFCKGVIMTDIKLLHDYTRLEDVSSKFGDVLKDSTIDLYIDIAEKSCIETYFDIKGPSQVFNGYALSPTIKIKFDERNGTFDTYPYTVKNNRIIVQREDGSVILIYERLDEAAMKAFKEAIAKRISIADKIKAAIRQIDLDLIKKEREDDPLF